METYENVPFRTEFWGICCESGKKYTQVVQKRFRVTKAILELPVKDTNSVVTLMVERGDLQYLICHLKAYTILQADLNLYFDKGEEISFLIKGQGKVHVIGYHIYGKNDVLESSDENHSMSSIKKSNVCEDKKPNIKEEKISIKHNEKSNFNLSNTKVKKIETVNPKLVKTEDTEDDSSSEEESGNEAVTTSAKKTLPVNVKNTKKKKSVEDSDEDDPFEELESTEDEEKEGLKMDFKQTKKRLWSSLTQDDDDDEDEDEDYEVEEEEEDEDDDEEEDSDESDSDDEDVPKETEKVSPEAKKLKKDTSTPLSFKKSSPNVQTKPTKVVNLDSDSSAMMNSSIGRTPMPKKKQIVNADQANLSFQKSSQKINSAKADASDSGMENSLIASPRKNENINATVPPSESKKKKKKKKSVDGLNNAMETDTSKPAKLSLSSASYSQKLPGGLEYEDIRIGNGPVAKKGRIVHVYYTGMLQNNKVIDSRENNTKPFSFKLGAQSVIPGWELGIEGMKVGGKRRLKIPPNLGYKNQKMGSIPPNSTLYFNIELKAVS